jgi:hypothetical protein
MRTYPGFGCCTVITTLRVAPSQVAPSLTLPRRAGEGTGGAEGTGTSSLAVDCTHRVPDTMGVPHIPVGRGLRTADRAQRQRP